MDDDKNNISTVSYDDIISSDENFVFSTMNYTMNTTPYTYGNITISNTGNLSNSVLNSITNPSLHVTGDSKFDGDIKIKGVSILETLESINKRLAILQPNPDKLKKFEALKKAYEHYKVLESLCEIEEKKE